MIKTFAPRLNQSFFLILLGITFFATNCGVSPKKKNSPEAQSNPAEIQKIWLAKSVTFKDALAMDLSEKENQSYIFSFDSQHVQLFYLTGQSKDMVGESQEYKIKDKTLEIVTKGKNISNYSNLSYFKAEIKTLTEDSLVLENLERNSSSYIQKIEFKVIDQESFKSYVAKIPKLTEAGPKVEETSKSSKAANFDLKKLQGFYLVSSVKTKSGKFYAQGSKFSSGETFTGKEEGLYIAGNAAHLIMNGHIYPEPKSISISDSTISISNSPSLEVKYVTENLDKYQNLFLSKYSGFYLEDDFKIDPIEEVALTAISNEKAAEEFFEDDGYNALFPGSPANFSWKLNGKYLCTQFIENGRTYSLNDAFEYKSAVLEFSESNKIQIYFSKEPYLSPSKILSSGLRGYLWEPRSYTTHERTLRTNDDGHIEKIHVFDEPNTPEDTLILSQIPGKISHQPNTKSRRFIFERIIENE